MANAFLTPDIIAREALVLLSSSLVTADLVHRDHAAEFTGAKIGDTVKIAGPASFVANEFTSSISVQNITIPSINLVLEKHFDVSFEVTSKEMTLELDQFSERILEPAMLTMATAVNGYTLSKYDEFHQFFDAGTTNPALPSTVAGWAQVPRVLNDANVPMSPRYGIVSSSAQASMLGLDAFYRADARPDGVQTLRDATMGRVLGIDWFMDQQVKTHTAGSFSTTGTPAVNGAVSAGASTMNIDGGAGTETLKKGDLFTVADVAGTYVVTADATASSGAITGVAFYPPAPAGGFPNDKAITVKKSHKANLALHPNALALATVPLALPAEAGKAVYVSYKGLGLRFASAYDISSKKNIFSFDLLCGAKAIQPGLGMRILEPAA